MAYLLDSNVFIQAKNLHYGFDFCPAFWEWIVNENKAKKVFSIEKVGDEIKAGDDELSVWADNYKDTLFLKPDNDMLAVFPRISDWATSKRYDPAAVNTFLQVADYYLVAHALAHDFTVVTLEVPSNSIRQIKIPDACVGLGVKVVTPYAMLRMEHARFVLKNE